ncbi:uncharacterized protein METZ01_LOCUS180963, partial [marine metagenome]
MILYTKNTGWEKYLIKSYSPTFVGFFVCGMMVDLGTMKRIILIALLLIVGCSKEPINDETLIEKGGLKHHPDTKKLYSGKVFTNHLGGKKESEGTYKDGKKDGKQTGWYENGQKMYEGTYKDGKIDGLNTGWYENGQKKREGTLKDGKEDGNWSYWYENGEKKEEGTWKDGKRNGTWIFYDESGMEIRKTKYKMGKIISDHDLNKNRKLEKALGINVKKKESSQIATQTDSNHSPIKSSGLGTIHTTVDKDPIPKKEIIPSVNIDHDAAVAQIQFIVSSRGTVHNVYILQGTGNAVLDNAAVDALKKTKFIPAVLNGESVSSRTKLDIEFKGHQTIKSSGFGTIHTTVDKDPIPKKEI